ncbi:hypothetical protein [Bordetella sp. BOR01]|uniref:hypothetical protein n=1 Tax=Bordetella sp. BOR01 TaxID=2854779 RepID=UPI001C48F03F|nr:hypothetical protein [Bordetella sp. BOR01]MBV7485196.1 hypothetical protein [Bordetella sp. BOR01]
MSIDRRIGLETAIPQGMPDLPESGAETRRDASDADRRAFEQAMAQGDGAAPADTPAATPRPFALFGVPQGTAAPGTFDPPEGLADMLASSADRLLVGDGSAGRREVRIELKDDMLPGVTLAVYEEAGRLVAGFVCANEASRERLCGSARVLAQEMAQSLARPALVRVSTDDPEDPCLLEEAADPGAP